MEELLACYQCGLLCLGAIGDTQEATQPGKEGDALAATAVREDCTLPVADAA